MWKNYLITALRNMRRQRGFTLVNVLGLALGMAVCLLVIMLIQDQRSYDRFHGKHDRIVRVVTERTIRGAQVHLAATPAYLGPQLERELPGVVETLRVGQIRADVKANGKAFALEGLAAEPSFFDLFDFEVLAGDPATALVGPGKVVLTDETATRFFGAEDPMGRAVEIQDFGGPYTVTGIVRTRGVKSHLRFSLLASFATLESVPEWKERLDAEENYWNFATYVLLADGTSPEDLQRSLARYGRTFRDTRYELRTQRLTSITLGPAFSNEIAAYNLPGSMVWMLAALGLIVMLAAGFNYVGLAVAQAVRRTKEIGVRKCVGAHRQQVAAQLLTESVIVALVALILGAVLFAALLPAFNRLEFLQRFAIELSLAEAGRPAVIGAFVVFSVLVGLLAGAYPAFRMSGFRPVWMLKGQLGNDVGSEGRFRKALTFVQLVIAFSAVVTTVLLYRQFEHLLAADLGFRSADVVTVALQGNDYTVLRDELGRKAGVRDISVMMRIPAVEGSSQTLIVHDEDTVQAEQLGVAAGALSILDIPVLAGRDLQDNKGPGLVITNELAERIGFQEPSEALGALLWTGTTGRDLQPVVGVARDFAPDAFGGSRPTFLYRPANLQEGYLMARVDPGQAMSVLSRAEEIWNDLDPAHEFDGGIYDDQIRSSVMYRVFGDVMRTVGFISALALAIACLGLLAMTANNVVRRTKEIGIRKVLGASIWSVVILLSTEILILLGVAACIALPVAYFGNSMWLQNIAYHVDLGVGILATGSAIVAVLVLLVVGAQAWRGARTEPAIALRYE